jgi:parvulin-like peptidyl-prolyl isomerase
MSRSLVVPALASALALGGCQAKDPVVMKLDGETLRRSDFERHVASVEARGSETLSEDARRGLLDTFLEQRALVIEARRRKLLAAGASEEREVEAVLQLLRSALPEPKISDREIEAWQQAHARELVMPERVVLRQILVLSINEARDVKRRLARDPRAFDVLAREISKGPEAAMGGYMGSFERGQLPAELEAAAFALPEAATSEPIETPLGYHVLRVESRETAREIPAEEARERIRGQLARERRTAAERAFVAQVLARAKVNHEAALRHPRPS